MTDKETILDKFNEGEAPTLEYIAIMTHYKGLDKSYPRFLTKKLFGKDKVTLADCPTVRFYAYEGTYYSIENHDTNHDYLQWFYCPEILTTIECEEVFYNLVWTDNEYADSVRGS